MQLIDGRPVFAATDLVGYLACEHRLALERAALAGLVAKPVRNDPSIDLVARRGDEHERRYLEELEATPGLRVVRIDKDGSAVAPIAESGTAGEPPPPPDAGARLRAAAAETITAMQGGADVVYQATFFDGTWRGHADFLLRLDHGPEELDSAFGPWHYEVADTKLARHVKASAILQVCSYIEQLTAVQRRQPEHLYIVLGGSARTRERLRVDDFMAYYRRVKADFERAVGLRGGVAPPAYPPAHTYPEPVEHCDVCRWAPECRVRRRRDDDLSLVAGASTRQRQALKTRGIGTRRGLGRLTLPMVPPLAGIGLGALARVREQARIQVDSDGLDRPRWELLPLDRGEDGEPVPLRGLLGLPEPSPGDLFLDLEGDPYALDDGVDYLFGILEPALAEDDPRWAGSGEDGRPIAKFHATWSLDVDGRVTWTAEKAAFERTVDLIMNRLESDPNLHVYHYAAYERTALGRLAQRHGTREDEVDRLLRGEVLVDLYRVVRQGLRAGVESYSIKKLEPLYGLRREVDLRDAGSSIVAFETWLELQPEAAVEEGPRILDEIAGYNRDDVVSTLRLRDWLEERRVDLEAREGRRLPRPIAPAPDPSAALTERQATIAALVATLTEGADDPADRGRNPELGGRWLLAQLLEWHRREDKSAYWRYFELMRMTDEELIVEREPIGGLEVVSGPEPRKRSQVWTFRFPPQDHRIDEDADVYDPVTGSSAGSVLAIDDLHGEVRLLRGPMLADVPLPSALVPKGIVPTKELAESLQRTGERVAIRGLEPADGDPDPVAAMLLRRPPDRLLDGRRDVRLPGETPLDAAVRVAPDLSGIVLPIQGPPGSGKTYTGAHMIVELVRRRQKVGVVANSHRVIGNLLDRVVEVAEISKVPVRIGQKPKRDAEPTCRHAVTIDGNGGVAAALRGDALDVVGAVAWTWCRGEMAEPEPVLDVLFVDEAGQMSLANVLACAPAARSIVLLGDPQQLDQPTKGSHPPGAERSALGHLLADPTGLEPDRATIAPDEGLFLEETWRLHPSICSFTSTTFYEGRLRPRSGLERQVVVSPATLGGTGIRHVPVDHAGNATDSPEEAARVASLVRDLLADEPDWIDREGVTHPLGLDDIVIVAPYNAHVAAIERAFEEAGLGAPFVGTVDKFQGQERPVSIYAMGTSSPEDAPRGMEFLYSLHRLNVATSRAQAVAAVVASPALLRVACRTPRQMRLANGLCLAVEAAGASAAAS